jgi:hypothetical protein
MKPFRLCVVMAVMGLSTACVVRAPVPVVTDGYLGVAPPAPLVEVAPAMPAVGYVWTPGYWAWHDRWVWQRGVWVAPRAGHYWVNGHWGHHPGHGWYWVGGGWRRG